MDKKMTDNEIIKALEGCTDNIFGEALDLIKRYKAENEKLRNALMGECMLSACSREKEIKDEAIKEFAERLRNCFCVSKEYLDIVNIIDNLVKEMNEEKNDFKE